MPASPRFLVDVGSPYAYLAAERVEQVLPVKPVWEPVLLGGIFRATGGGSWALTEARPLGIEEVERRAAEHGLPPVRWPEPWPGDMLLAMRAATAADLAGSGREFLLAALRLGFREGRDLSAPDAIADAARTAGIEGDELLAAASDPAVKATLRQRTHAAVAGGVRGVPTIVVGDKLFWGDDQLEAAAACGGV